MNDTPEKTSGGVEPNTLYIVATPIGNLGDLGDRARHTLERVDFIAAEDTRHSARLLKAFSMNRPMVALHEHNEADKAPEIIRRLEQGESAALISDAGTPLVSDPGYRLVRAAQEAGLPVRAVPGPSAAIAALSVAGLPTDRFAFEGFLPARKGARRARLDELTEDPRTLVFFEAPHRLKELLADCVGILGPEREGALVRELTKVHESSHRAPLGELYRRVDTGEEPARGECVVLITGAKQHAVAAGQESDELLKALLAEGISPSTAAAVARRLFPEAKRRDLYQRAMTLGPD
jgi:16S rRNA (cytidine1402-2'-O)-methyltransferase